jgi:hypothetical protein
VVEIDEVKELEEVKKVKNREKAPYTQREARIEELEENEAGLQFNHEGCFALGYL